jgi:hypothetical protein
MTDSLFILGLVFMVQGFMVGLFVGLLTGHKMPPKPKSGKRVISQKVIDWVRGERDGTCMYGWFYKDPCGSQALQVHHIQRRSQLGDDDPANLITLCSFHHDQAERHIIAPEKLQHVLTATGAGKEKP